MKIKKTKKISGLYIPLDDLKKINDDFLSEMESVKKRLTPICDKDITNKFQEVLLNAYSSAIEIKTLERETDYKIKLAEIKARDNEQTPWRHCRLWRLLFQPLTNRAQDIIEERAELDADFIHTAAENEIENDRKKLPPVDEQETFICRLKRKLKAIFKRNGTDDNETSAEPSAVTQEQENAAIVQEPVTEQEPVQEPPEPPTRKPRKDKKSEG